MFGVFGVAAGDAHGFVVALLLAMPALLVVPAAVPAPAAVLVVVDVCAPAGVLLGAVVVMAGQGAVVLVLFPEADVVLAPFVAPAVPVVEVAPAGTFEFGFVVDVAEAGVVPVVFVVPFC